MAARLFKLGCTQLALMQFQNKVSSSELPADAWSENLLAEIKELRKISEMHEAACCMR